MSIRATSRGAAALLDGGQEREAVTIAMNRSSKPASFLLEAHLEMTVATAAGKGNLGTFGPS